MLFHKAYSYIRPHLLPIFALFLVSLTPLLWFRSGEIMIGHDNVFPLKPMSFLEERLSTWSNQGLGQEKTHIMGSVVVHAIDALPYSMGLSLAATQKIVYVFWFAVMAVSMYALAAVIRPKDRYFGLSATVLYVFNFFILQGWWIGERTKFAVYAATALLLALYIQVWRGKIQLYKGIAAAGIIFFIANGGGLYGIPLFGGAGIVIGMFVGSSFLHALHKKDFVQVGRVLVLSAGIVIAALLVNMHAIVPVASTLKRQMAASVAEIGGSVGVIDWINEISANTSYLNLIRLQGIPEWYDNPQHPYATAYLSNPLLIALSFVFPLLVIWSILRIRKTQYARYGGFLSGVYIASIFFSAGTHPPFGYLYALLIRYVPGFIIFRTPYFKFAPALLLSTSLLIAFGLSTLKGSIKKAAAACYVLFVLIYHAPYFTGNFFQWHEDFSTRVPVPGYVFEFADWAEDRPQEGRILLSPHANFNRLYDMYTWGYFSLQSLPSLATNYGVLVNDDWILPHERDQLNDLYRALSEKDQRSFEEGARALNIRYILNRRDIRYDVPWSSSADPAKIDGILSDQFNYEIERAFGPWDLYEIADYTDQAASIFSNVMIYQGSLSSLGPIKKLAGESYSIPYSDVDTYRLRREFTSDTYVITSDCLNCDYVSKTHIYNPQPQSTLPESILYHLVVQKENIMLGTLSGRELLYAHAGLSLKRAGELVQLLSDNKKVPQILIDRYEWSIAEMEQLFMNIETKGERYRAATDMLAILAGQQIAIQSMLVQRIDVEIDRENVKKILNNIEDLKRLLDDAIPESIQDRDRVYSIAIQNEGEYEIYLDAHRMKDILSSSGTFDMQIGRGPKNTYTYTEDALIHERWLPLESPRLFAGEHIATMTLKDQENLAVPDQSGVGYDEDSSLYCHELAIKKFDSHKRYVITYDGSAPQTMLLYIRQPLAGQGELQSVYQINDINPNSKIIEFDPPAGEVVAAELKLCLAEEWEEESIVHNVTIEEQASPQIVLVNKKDSAFKELPVSYTYLTPTTRRISFDVSTAPVILMLAERYDPLWELSMFDESQFMVNGYANGWVIDTEGSYTLDLNYSPQKFFLIGLGVSIAAVSSFVFILAAPYLTRARFKGHS